MSNAPNFMPRRRGFAAAASRVGNAVINKAVGAAVGAGLAYAGKKMVRSSARPAQRAQNRPAQKKKGKVNTQRLAKQVANLSKKVSLGEGKLTFYFRDTARLLGSVNQASHYEVGGVPVTTYEDALAQLRFFDPTTPNTLVQASGASATYRREYSINYYHMSEIRNNYQIPCKVTLYVCSPKVDTSIGPATAYTNGLADIGNPSSTSQLLHLTISPQFNELWKIESSKTKMLQPGQQMSISHGIKSIMYDPSLIDSHALAYQKSVKSTVIIVRLEGCLAHDSAANEQGFALSGIDINYQLKMVVKYDAGADIEYVYINDQANTFTNGALVSSYPVADNIGYSLS